RDDHPRTRRWYHRRWVWWGRQALRETQEVDQPSAWVRLVLQPRLGAGPPRSLAADPTGLPGRR
ncbi:hypothetical protein, partial [Mycolicibacter senuensis]|uniref:hypothetical protein n=1 Tax=Mycolicibacter senuensis TaxID=386913 RepID=UPI00197C2BBD